jgi:hypothetical protein
MRWSKPFWIVSSCLAGASLLYRPPEVQSMDWAILGFSGGAFLVGSLIALIKALRRRDEKRREHSVALGVPVSGTA